MVPSVFTSVEQLPLTPNGKLDRKALPQVPAIRLPFGGRQVAPRNDLERRLCAIWQEVLGVEGIGIRENFFDLGGHSLQAMQVVSRVGRSLGVTLGLRDFFDQPSIAELAGLLAGNGRGGAQPGPEWQPALPDGGCIHQRFEAQAGRTPDAVAVEFGAMPDLSPGATCAECF